MNINKISLLSVLSRILNVFLTILTFDKIGLLLSLLPRSSMPFSRFSPLRTSRLFCGDLGNDVTDEVLARTFGRYPSFQKAKVIRDKKSNKTKGFGFVSFREPGDFTRAVKEINGKYVGSRPIKLRKSNWKDRNIDVVKQKQKMKQQMGYKW